jgi:hypothetical protein
LTGSDAIVFIVGPAEQNGYALEVIIGLMCRYGDSEMATRQSWLNSRTTGVSTVFNTVTTFEFTPRDWDWDWGEPDLTVGGLINGQTTIVRIHLGSPDSGSSRRYVVHVERDARGPFAGVRALPFAIYTASTVAATPTWALESIQERIRALTPEEREEELEQARVDA